MSAYADWNTTYLRGSGGGAVTFQSSSMGRVPFPDALIVAPVPLVR